jgi:uncharacterized membrane protein
MNWYTFFKFLHVLAVIASVGGLFARQLVREYAKGLQDVHTFANFSQAALKIERTLVIPGMSAILVLGVIVGLIGRSPILGFLQGASQNWLLVSNILIIGILVLIPTVLVPRSKQFEPLLQAALAKGEMTPELREAANDGVVALAHLYEEVAVVVIAALMVIKPF